MNFIMESPPLLTGNVEEDLKALRDHIAELQDELEYTLTRRLEDDGN